MVMRKVHPMCCGILERYHMKLLLLSYPIIGTFITVVAQMYGICIVLERMMVYLLGQKVCQEKMAIVIHSQRR